MSTHAAHPFYGLTWQDKVVVPVSRTALDVGGAENVRISNVGFADTTGRRDADSRVLPSEAAADENAAVRITNSRDAPLQRFNSLPPVAFARLDGRPDRPEPVRKKETS